MRTAHLIYKRTSPMQNLYHDELYEHIVELITTLPGRPELSNLSVLDLGCGRGELLQKLAERDIRCTGLDVDPVCVDMSGRYASCIQGDITRAADYFEAKSFDVVVASHIIEHLPAPIVAVEQMKILSSRWVILAVPNLSALNVFIGEWYRYLTNGSVTPGHMCGWNYSHFKIFLENHCGLKTKFAPDLVVLPMPLKLHNWTFRILKPLYQALAHLFPTFGPSLLVLCEISNAGSEKSSKFSNP